jgi:integral membrane protein TerC family protein
MGSWAAFIIFVLFLLALDLGVFHRKARVISLNQALIASGVWIGVALVFNVFVYFADEAHWFGLDLPDGKPEGWTAVLGLRSLYFALAGIIDRFYYLKLSLALLLVLIGTKMLLKDVLETLPGTTYYTLGAITLILGGGIVASLVRARRASESRRIEVPARGSRLAHR